MSLEVFFYARITCKKKSDFKEMAKLAWFISFIEPRNIDEAVDDEFWKDAMHKNMEKFTRLQVWDLVPRPVNVNIIRTWIYKNNINEDDNVIRNKEILIAQGYSKIEEIDIDETFAPVAQLESIRLLFGITCKLWINLNQMDVKNESLNGVLQDKVYVAQSKGFEYPHFPDHGYKLIRALYGLKQALRTWYEVLILFLIKDGFKQGELIKRCSFKRKESIFSLSKFTWMTQFSAAQQMVVNFVETMTREF